jgi:hypothetical protein
MMFRASSRPADQPPGDMLVEHIEHPDEPLPVPHAGLTR